MFDYHMHCKVSTDSVEEPAKMIQAAKAAGLKQICFTDHYDHHWNETDHHHLFCKEEYRSVFDDLHDPDIRVCKGVEFGLNRWNKEHLKEMVQWYPFDFVLGSVHFAQGRDPYEPEYWEGKTVHQAFEQYLQEVYRCVKLHDDFDVLGHLTYVCKSVHNPTREPVKMADFQDLTDEIMKVLVQKGKGMEINTSGVDRCGAFLPSADFMRRFKELGGQIVTVGSDAHDAGRVGQYCHEAAHILQDLFGYVCTFEGRKPTFHKL